MYPVVELMGMFIMARGTQTPHRASRLEVARMPDLPSAIMDRNHLVCPPARRERVHRGASATIARQSVFYRTTKVN